MRASTLTRILVGIAKISWLVPTVGLSFIRYMPTWQWAVALGIGVGVLFVLWWKFVEFALLSRTLFGDIVITCKGCGKVSNPGASAFLVDILKKMQEQCECSKEIPCSSHGSKIG